MFFKLLLAVIINHAISDLQDFYGWSLWVYFGLSTLACVLVFAAIDVSRAAECYLENHPPR